MSFAARRLFQLRLGEHAEALAFSPDGKTLAVGTLAGALSLVDAESGELRRGWEGHHDGVYSAAFSPDGGLLAVGTGAGEGLLYKVSDGSLVASLKVGTGWTEHIAWGKGGTAVAFAAGKVLTVATPAGMPQGRFDGHESSVTALLARPKVGGFATGCLQSARLIGKAGTKVERLLEDGSGIVALTMSPDEQWLIAGHQDGSMRAWNLTSGSDLEMSGYPTKVRALAWGERGPWLATAGGSTVVLWSFTGKGPARTKPAEIEGHSDKIMGLAFAQGGQLLLSAGADGLFHGAVQEGKEFRSVFVDDVKGPLVRLVVARQGTAAAAAGRGGDVFAWGLRRGAAGAEGEGGA